MASASERDKRHLILMRLAETVEDWGVEADDGEFQAYAEIAESIRALAACALPEEQAAAIAEAQIARLAGVN